VSGPFIQSGPNGHTDPCPLGLPLESLHLLIFESLRQALVETPHTVPNLGDSEHPEKPPGTHNVPGVIENEAQ
jgi:hypothetical protein